MLAYLIDVIIMLFYQSVDLLHYLLCVLNLRGDLFDFLWLQSQVTGRYLLLKDLINYVSLRLLSGGRLPVVFILDFLF